LGVKSGEGFYRYQGCPYEQTLKKRDAQLLKSVDLAAELMGEPLHDPG